MEFGTAGKALAERTAFGMKGGRGTNSTTGGYYDDALAWYFAIEVNPKTGKPSKWKRATAITPTMPMHHASLSMMEAVVKTAKEVFSE